jgi:hypothetical protein
VCNQRKSLEIKKKTPKSSNKNKRRNQTKSMPKARKQIRPKSKLRAPTPLRHISDTSPTHFRHFVVAPKTLALLWPLVRPAELSFLISVEFVCSFLGIGQITLTSAICFADFGGSFDFGNIFVTSADLFDFGDMSLISADFCLISAMFFL